MHRPLPDKTARALAFARAWLGNPRRVGAVAPSGRALAQAITREITPDSAPVIELGPGTGVFTEALLAKGIAADRLALVEASPGLAAGLRRMFPAVRVIESGAEAMTASVFGLGQTGAIVSGIPILAMRDADVRSILGFCFGELRPGAGLYQFTYGPRCPVKDAVLHDLGLGWRRIKTTWRNLPPATVYRIGRLAER